MKYAVVTENKSQFVFNPRTNDILEEAYNNNLCSKDCNFTYGCAPVVLSTYSLTPRVEEEFDDETNAYKYIENTYPFVNDINKIRTKISINRTIRNTGISNLCETNALYCNGCKDKYILNLFLPCKHKFCLKCAYKEEDIICPECFPIKKVE